MNVNHMGEVLICICTSANYLYRFLNGSFCGQQFSNLKIHSHYHMIMKLQSPRILISLNKNPAIFNFLFLSWFTSRWMNDVFKKGYKHPLENSDIYEILPEDESQELTDRLERLVKERKWEG